MTFNEKQPMKKKYALPLICGALLIGGMWGASAMLYPGQTTQEPNKTATSQAKESSKQTEGSRTEAPSTNKEAKQSQSDDLVTHLYEQYDLEKKTLPLATSSLLGKTDIETVVQVLHDKQKEQEQPKEDEQGTLPPQGLVPPTDLPEIPEIPLVPIEPEQPSVTWTAPTIDVAQSTIVLGIGSPFQLFNYIRVIPGSDAQPIIEATSVDTSSSSQQLVHITVTDSKGNQARAQLQVIINEAPYLSVLSPEVTTQIDQEVDILSYVSAFDKEDGSITPDITYSGKVDSHTEGSYPITYSVKDSLGFEATATITFHVKNEAPIIHVKNVTHPINQKFNPLEGMTVTDKEEGMMPLTSENVLDNQVNIFEEGTYTITLGNVADSHGKAAENVTYTVTIVNEAPTISNEHLVLTEGDFFDANAYREQLVIEDKEDSPLGIPLLTWVSEDDLLAVDTSVPGRYPITIRATDTGAKTTERIGFITVLAKEETIEEIVPEVPSLPEVAPQELLEIEKEPSDTTIEESLA